MVTVILYKVDDTDSVSKLPLMRLDNSLKMFSFVGPTVNENILILSCFDMLETKNGTICIEFSHLLKGEGVDVRIDC